jgi:hypothetical protein
MDSGVALSNAVPPTGPGGPSAPSGTIASPQPSPSPSPTVVTSVRWVPKLTDTWQLQLHGVVNTSYDVNVYDIDLFDTPQSTIDELKKKGRRVVCYFSAGSSEDWRADFAQFAATDKGKPIIGWRGENWLDTRSGNVRRIMKARLDLAVTKGCDGVDPDNLDGYMNDSGLALNASTQLEYNRFIAAEAHARNLAVGLKNDTDHVAALSADFDFAVNEECHRYGVNGSECDVYVAFTSAGKPVFNVEYFSDYVLNKNGARDALCARAQAQKFHTIVLPIQLDGSLRFSCD